MFSPLTERRVVDDNHSLCPVPRTGLDWSNVKRSVAFRIRNGGQCKSRPPGPISARCTGTGVKLCTVWTLTCRHLEAGGTGLVLDSAASWCVGEGVHGNE